MKNTFDDSYRQGYRFNHPSLIRVSFLEFSWKWQHPDSKICRNNIVLNTRCPPFSAMHCWSRLTEIVFEFLQNYLRVASNFSRIQTFSSLTNSLENTSLTRAMYCGSRVSQPKILEVIQLLHMIHLFFSINFSSFFPTHGLVCGSFVRIIMSRKRKYCEVDSLSDCVMIFQKVEIVYHNSRKGSDVFPSRSKRWRSLSIEDKKDDANKNAIGGNYFIMHYNRKVLVLLYEPPNFKFKGTLVFCAAVD